MIGWRDGPDSGLAVTGFGAYVVAVGDDACFLAPMGLADAALDPSRRPRLPIDFLFWI
ncbi:hypothetical protein [Rhizosaccharibacter radicis]|uniref:Uncharacterized protein n=1 Tax=Rhizosaccharibacter radicis TaxID=2782605 RepID=A0ABT1VSC2_9PROT|nr:hypothetical protein [Acetobacteraceae bacterium KSS12]